MGIRKYDITEHEWSLLDRLTDCLTPVKTKMAVIACILAEILTVTLV